MCDVNFPALAIAGATTLGKVLRIDRPTAEVARAVLSVYPIDDFVDDAAARMEVVGEPTTTLPIMEAFQREMDAEGGPRAIGLERVAFYARAKKSFALLQTSERRLYGCFAFRKGVVSPTD